MRLKNAHLLTRKRLQGVWFRSVRPGHFATALSYAHTTSIPGRFNPGTTSRPAFPVIYFGEDPIVCLFEVQAMLGTPLPGYVQAANPQAGHWAVVQIDISLGSIVDLTRSNQRKIIGTTVQELTGDWRAYGLRAPNARLHPPHYTNVPTQRLGAALRAVRSIEGFMTYSARVPTRKALVVFPDRLRRGSRIRFTDPNTGVTQTLP